MLSLPPLFRHGMRKRAGAERRRYFAFSHYAAVKNVDTRLRGGVSARRYVIATLSAAR